MVSRNPELETLRLECLRLALEAENDCKPVDLAKTFFEFVIDAKPETPRQRIDAALEDAGL